MEHNRIAFRPVDLDKEKLYYDEVVRPYHRSECQCILSVERAVENETSTIGTFRFYAIGFPFGGNIKRTVNAGTRV